MGRATAGLAAPTPASRPLIDERKSREDGVSARCPEPKLAHSTIEVDNLVRKSLAEAGISRLLRDRVRFPENIYCAGSPRNHVMAVPQVPLLDSVSGQAQRLRPLSSTAHRWSKADSPGLAVD